MESDELVVAVAQHAPVPGDVAENARRAAALVAEAADADLLLFPLLSLTGYDLHRLAEPSAWTIPDDPRLDVVREASRAHGVTTVVGAAWAGPDGRVLASVALSPDGGVEVVGKHHLSRAERELFEPAGPAHPVDVRGWRVALAVCFDAAAPEHALEMARRGADVYAVSALYTEGQERRLDVHPAARALDHRMYALVANLAGAGPGWRSCGGSGVWHPDGRRVAAAGAGAQVVTARLERAELDRLRAADAAAGYRG
ncbi:carbon-nitrogen hydrolase family protein [Saccharothrix sp. S26]|uniref:carbon-nitrogen hydrolase family protein n=1 Tax=Saccharothrix sp. S26 TaxID=2907215 RepID=UPI001F24FC94|nr:carbon-nitrogen hydrolase family protein [Saccharothrix sp. S26]MCE6995194.1 carbon-nitrogen hydrolase family protein [Saccharothrix sp. S26]